MVHKTFFILLLFFTCQNLAFGQKRYQFELFDQGNYLGYHFDDDFLFIYNRDEQYTGGLEFEWLHQASKIKIKRGLFNPFHSANRYFTMTAGTQLFTPYNVSDSLIILNDRPFSSYLFASFGYTAYDLKKERKLTMDFYLGIMGSEFPGNVQHYIHQFGDSPPANGWPNKLASKETFIPNLRLNYQRNKLTIGPIYRSMFDWVQVGTIWELNTGFYMNSVKSGLKISGFNHQPTSTSQVILNTFRQERKRKSNWKMTTYFMPQFQLIGYNTSLQSLPWLYSPYSIETDLITRFIWIIEAGINLTHNHFHLTYLVQSRTKEFTKYQHSWHAWGGVTMGFSF